MSKTLLKVMVNTETDIDFNAPKFHDLIVLN